MIVPRVLEKEVAELLGVLKDVDKFLRICLADEVCNLADPMIEFESHTLVGDVDVNRGVTSVGKIYIPSIINIDELLYLINLLKKYFRLDFFECGKELIIKIESNEINEVLKILSKISNKMHSLASTKARSTLIGVLTESGTSWDLTLELCHTIDQSDTSLEIAELGGRLILNLIQILELPVRDDYQVSVNRVIPNNFTKPYLCAGLTLDLK